MAQALGDVALAFWLVRRGSTPGGALTQVAGPCLHRADITLATSRQVTEKARVEFRCDVFHVTNTPNLTAMETWREQGKAPDQITAYRVSNDRVNLSRRPVPIRKWLRTRAQAIQIWHRTSSTSSSRLRVTGEIHRARRFAHQICSSLPMTRPRSGRAVCRRRNDA